MNYKVAVFLVVFIFIHTTLQPIIDIEQDKWLFSNEEKSLGHSRVDVDKGVYFELT